MPRGQRQPAMDRESPVEWLFIDQLKALPQHDQLWVRENFLTASFAGALASSLSLRRRFCRMIVGGDHYKGERVSRASIAAYAQELEIGGSLAAPDKCRLDLVLEINGSRQVAVEIKLYSAEGVDVHGRRQLDRYLRLRRFDGVAYLAAMETPTSAYAWKRRNANYLIPRDRRGQPTRGHFLWSDLYAHMAPLSRGRHAPPLVVAFRRFLEWLGLRPIHPLIGELGGRTAFDDASPTVRQNRRRIQVAMRAVQKALVATDWETADVRNNGTLYAWPTDPRHPIWRLWLSPGVVSGSFRVWIELHQRNAQARATLASRLPSVIIPALAKNFGRDLFPVVRPVLERTQRPSVDVRIPYQTMLAGLRKTDAVAARLTLAADTVAQAATWILRRSSR